MSSRGRDEDLSGDETLVSRSFTPIDGPRALPCLTILFHADLRRIGERCLLRDGRPGGRMAVSRTEPAFARPGDAEGLALRDPYLSRTPTTFTGTTDNGITISVADGQTIKVDDEIVDNRKMVSSEELDRGVVVALSKRIVLLLHRVRPTALPPQLGLVGESAGIFEVRQAVTRVADIDVPVLIRGETGVGKERIAQAIHESSERAGQACVAVNMAAISPTTAASELFGHVKGSFTGATGRHAGLFERADGGTLFLDEVGATPDNIQAMLLRVLETGVILPIGTQSEHHVDVRIIAATDADLEAAGRDGTFRTALLHRLAGYEISIPALRERREDIPRLVVHFLREELERLGDARRLSPPERGKPLWFPASLMVRLFRHDWPGNVRQLRNVVRQLVISSRGAATVRADRTVERLLEDIQVSLTADPDTHEPPPTFGQSPVGKARRRKASDVSDESLVNALISNDWAIGPTASSLGIPRSSLYDLIEKSRTIRKAKDVSREELERCFTDCGGDVSVMAGKLRVSKRGLKLRIKELGLSE